MNATLIPESQRIAHTAKLFGVHFPLRMEPTVYALAPRPVMPTPSAQGDDEPVSVSARQLEILLAHLDPSMGYTDWMRVMMASYHATGGGADGLRAFDAWSATSEKYKGYQEVEYKWQSLKNHSGRLVTIQSIYWMLEARGVSWKEILADAEPGFEAIDPGDCTLPPEANSSAGTPDEPAVEASTETVSPASSHPLDKYSITGSHATLSENSRGLMPVLGKLAMRGQYSILFAGPNVGKTLLMMHLIERGVTEGHVDPANVYYISADDSESGMLEKLALAEEWGIQMLVPGYNQFFLKDLPVLLAEIRQSGQAPETVIVLDTLKKAASTNDKSKIAAFNQHIRLFCTLGGTFIALHHTNKYPNDDGEVVFSGTSDLMDDVDAAYNLKIQITDIQNQTQIIACQRKKGRGGVVGQAAYRYSLADGQSYRTLLASVEEVDPLTLEDLHQAEVLKTHEPIIKGIKAVIRSGTTQKMKIIQHAAPQTGVSQRQVKHILEAYTGTDPVQHHWSNTKGERGTLIYTLL